MTDPLAEDNAGPVPAERFALARKVCLVLCLLTVSIFAMRLGVEKLTPVTDDAASAWQLTWEFDLVADRPNVSFNLYLPRETRYVSLYSQSLQHAGLRVKRVNKKNNTRVLTIIAKEPGVHRFTIAFDFFNHAAPYNTFSRQTKLSPEEKNTYVTIDDTDPLTDAFIDNIETIGSKGETDTEIIEQIYQLIQEKLKLEKSVEDNRDLYYAKSMIALSRASYVPARLVTGFSLSGTNTVQPQYWVEIWLNGAWETFDPADKHYFTRPTHYVPVRRSHPSIIDYPDNAQLLPRYTIQKQRIPAGLFGHEARLIDVLDFTRLSYIDREILALLMLLPLGGLLTVFLRRMIGMRPFGTFAPTLLALSAAVGDWLSLSIIFTVVIFFGIIGRAMLPNLKLGRKPRLAIVFTLVSISMVFSISLLRYFNIETGEIGTLLPIVVMAILVDSFYITADKDGLRAAFIRLVWTLVVSTLILLIFISPDAGLLLLSYPELHLLTLALIILIGNYKNRSFIEKLSAYSIKG